MRCPYCAENIQEEAIICRHCQKDLSTTESKTLISKKIIEEQKKNEQEEFYNLKQKLTKKIEQYPKILRNTFTKNLKSLKKLETMTDEDIQKDIFTKQRKTNIIILRVATFILCLILSSWYLFIVAIWLHPKKEESKIFENRLNDFKNRKTRIIFTIIIFFIALISHQTSIQQKNNEQIIQAKLDKEALTKLSVNFEPNEDITKEEFLNITIDIQNIQELSINKENIDIEGKNILTQRFQLNTGGNEILIVGLNDEIKRENRRLITRISVEEYEKYQREEQEKAEAIKKQQEELNKIEAKKKEIEDRNQKIKNQFSSWDGSHILFKSIIQDALKDPKSFEHIETRYYELKEDNGTYYIGVTMKYRAKNSFGGYVIETYTGFFDLDGNPIKTDDRFNE